MKFLQEYIRFFSNFFRNHNRSFSKCFSRCSNRDFLRNTSTESSKFCWISPEILQKKKNCNKLFQKFFSNLFHKFLLDCLQKCFWYFFQIISKITAGILSGIRQCFFFVRNILKEQCFKDIFGNFLRNVSHGFFSEIL